MIYRVEAEAQSGRTYVYEVSGPSGASDTVVASAAYRQHGRTMQALVDPLTPNYYITAKGEQP